MTNRDWDNWTDVMSPSGAKPDNIRETHPRPGHADLAGVLKIGSDDTRDILERASARETAARVAAGGVAQGASRRARRDGALLRQSIGSVAMPPVADPAAVDADVVEASAVRCPDFEASEAMKVEIDTARADGESLGGMFVVTATGLVPGIGDLCRGERDRLDARLAAAVMSIPAIKGFEVGDGFRLADVRGSQAHDPIHYDAGAASPGRPTTPAASRAA